MQRATIIVVVVFAVIYVVVAAGGAGQNRSQRAPSSSNATPLAIAFDPSALTPAFARVAPQPSNLVVAPGGSIAIPVPATSEKYLVAHFRCVQCLGGAKTVRIDHLGADGSTPPKPDTMGAGEALTIVVPQGAPPIQLSCQSGAACIVSGP